MENNSDRSGFHIPCLCGETVIAQQRETVCRKCGRVLNVEAWGADPDIVQ